MAVVIDLLEATGVGRILKRGGKLAALDTPSVSSAAMQMPCKLFHSAWHHF